MSKRTNRRSNSNSDFDLANVYGLNPRQDAVLTSDKHQVLMGFAGTGKAQPGSSKIRTPTGWTTMRDIEVGDKVITPTNNVASVLNKYYHKDKNVYKLTFYDGREVLSCGEHLWKASYGTRSNKLWSVVDTLFLKERLSLGDRVYIPLTEPIQQDTEENLPIHPYLLGALIGDGCFRTNTLKFSSADSYIIDKIKSLLPKDYNIWKPESSKHTYDYTIGNVKDKYDNYLVQQLKLLGLWGKLSQDKFIPTMYMNLSINNTLELLQGLMDTDGTIDARCSMEYSTSSKELAYQVAELIYSLGGYCSVTPRMGSYRDKFDNKKITIENYRVIPSRLTYELKSKLFSLPRKLSKVKKGQYDEVDKLRIKSISYHSTEDCWCISIDSKEKLYLTDNYIVTHNTFLASYMAYSEVLDMRSPYNKLLYVRSAIPTRDIGFLPGTDEEKLEVYEAPYMVMASKLFGRGDAYEVLKKRGVVQFKSTSFVRGMNIDNCILIVDECQNMTYHELDSIVTRLEDNCKIFFCGDARQSDLNKNGIKDFFKVLEHMEEFNFVEFTKDDIVRSELVKNYIIKKSEILDLM